MSAPKPWFVCARPRPAATKRLLCFPHAGGNSSAFHAWAKLLPANIELWAFEPAGRNRRHQEPPETDLNRLVAALAGVLAPVLDRPYAMLGNSLGALVAFELARVLRAQNTRAPLHLFFAGHGAPDQPLSTPILHALPENELIVQLKDLAGTPEQVFQDPELLEFALRILRADFQLFETHIFRENPPLAVPLTALGGLEDRWVKAAELEGWRRQTTGKFEVRTFPGGHFFLEDRYPEVVELVLKAAFTP